METGKKTGDTIYKIPVKHDNIKTDALTGEAGRRRLTGSLTDGIRVCEERRPKGQLPGPVCFMLAAVRMPAWPAIVRGQESNELHNEAFDWGRGRPRRRKGQRARRSH